MRIPSQIRKPFGDYFPITRAVVILIVSVSGFIFGVIPASRTIWSMYEDSQSVSADIRALTQKATILGSLDTDTLQQQLEEFFSAVPVGKAVPSLFTTLENLSTQTGVSLLDVSLTGIGGISSDSGKVATHESGAKLLRFSASVEGSMEQITKFFKDVSHIRRFVGVRSFDVTIGSITEATTSGLVRSKLEMETYYATLPSHMGSAISPINPLSDKEEETLQLLTSIPNLATMADIPPPSLGGISKADPFSP